MTHIIKISIEQLDKIEFGRIEEIDIWLEKHGIEVKDHKSHSGASLIFNREEDAVVFRLKFGI
jgi:hypothetical protein